MASPRRLAYKDRSVWELEQVVSAQWDDCDGFTDRYVFPDMSTRVPLVLYLSQAEWTTLYSAVLTGADLTYPDSSHDVENLFLQSVTCAMNQFCAAMIDCLMNDSDVWDALQELLAQNGMTGGAGDGSAPLGGGVLGDDLLPAGYACTNDKAFGMALAIVDAINDATTEVLQAIEVLTNPIEIAAELGDNIPGIGMLASAGDMASWIQDTAKEQYDLAWSTTVRDELACDIWCVLLEHCELSFDDIWNVYLSASAAAPPPGVSLQDWVAWLILLPFTGGKATVATVSLMGLLAMRYGGRFGDFSIGIRSLETVMKLSEDASDPNWATACDACIYSWCVELDPTDPNVEIYMLQAGMYYDAGGWHGNNPVQNDRAGIQVGYVDDTFTQTRIEIDFITNGDRQYGWTDGPELQITMLYTGNWEYPAGLQTHTVVSGTVGTFRIGAGDYATIVAVRIYGEGPNPFSSPICS